MATGHLEKSSHHIGGLKFGNSRHDEAWGSQIRSNPCGGAAESAEDSVWIVMVVKRVFAKLNALGDVSTSTIYLGEKIISYTGRATDHPGRSDGHIGGLGFKNQRHDVGWGNQIGSGLSDNAALEGRGAGRGVPVYRDLREASEGEGEADGRLHLDGDAGREDDAGVGYH